MFEVRGPMMVSGDYDTNISSTLETILKDIACISEHARDVACPTPLFSLAGDIHRAAAAQGFAMSDPAVVCKTIGLLAGIDRS
jgi:3-hydroxyisobutyrate dehydrogenase-like beta-hydroxyacid dehydrogenase